MEARELYQRILQVVNFYLDHALILTIKELQNFDPSIEEIARSVNLLAKLLKEIASENYDDENMAINAFQCVIVLEQITKAVRAGDEQRLNELVKELEMHIAVP